MNNVIYSAQRFKLSEEAQRVMRQQAIPLMVAEYLLRYGKAVADGQGGKILYFDQGALERILYDEDRAGILKLHRYFNTYLVKDASGVVAAVSRYDRRAVQRRQAA